MASCSQIRELLEEINLHDSPFNVRLGPVTNDFFLDVGKHYVDIYCSVEISRAQKKMIKIMEPEKCSEIRWYELAGDMPLSLWADTLPQPLFPSFSNWISVAANTGRIAYPPFRQFDIIRK